MRNTVLYHFCPSAFNDIQIEPGTPPLALRKCFSRNEGGPPGAVQSHHCAGQGTISERDRPEHSGVHHLLEAARLLAESNAPSKMRKWTASLLLHRCAQEKGCHRRYHPGRRCPGLGRPCRTSFFVRFGATMSASDS